METCDGVALDPQFTKVYFWAEDGSEGISSSSSNLSLASSQPSQARVNMACMAAMHNQVESEKPGSSGGICVCKDCRRSRAFVPEDEGQDRESCCMCAEEQEIIGIVKSPSSEDSDGDESYDSDSSNGSKESAFGAGSHKGVILPNGGNQRTGIKYGVNRFPRLDPQESHALMMKVHRKEFPLLRGLHRVMDPLTGKEKMELRDDVSEFSQGSKLSKATSIMGSPPRTSGSGGFFGRCFSVCHMFDKLSAADNQFERGRQEPKTDMSDAGASDIPTGGLPDPDDMR